MRTSDPHTFISLSKRSSFCLFSLAFCTFAPPRKRGRSFRGLGREIQAYNSKTVRCCEHMTEQNQCCFFHDFRFCHVIGITRLMPYMILHVPTEWMMWWRSGVNVKSCLQSNCCRSTGNCDNISNMKPTQKML